MRLIGIVLAAGQGKRMKSSLYKVLHPVCGKPMIGHVVDALEEAGVDKTMAIVGHGSDAVRAYLGNRVEYALQEEQLGTGHAVMQATDQLSNEEGMTIVVCGDTPLIRATTLQTLAAYHQEHKAACTILSAKLGDPHGYGRILRSDDGYVQRIVEQKDCSEEEERICEINTGTYIFDNQKLFAALSHISNNNAQGEYYLTDVIGILRQQDHLIEALSVSDPEESIGVNDRIALAEAERIMRRRINHNLMLQGVTIVDPEHTYIASDVTIGSDTIVHPGVVLEGTCQIGANCVIGPNTHCSDVVIGDQCEVRQSVLTEATVGANVQVGPYAYVRPGTVVQDNVKVGAFVEIKNSTINSGSKVPHLSYVGDADVGKDVNIGLWHHHRQL